MVEKKMGHSVALETWYMISVINCPDTDIMRVFYSKWNGRFSGNKVNKLTNLEYYQPNVSDIVFGYDGEANSFRG